METKEIEKCENCQDTGYTKSNKICDWCDYGVGVMDGLQAQHDNMYGDFDAADDNATIFYGGNYEN
jgi:hypothetical protein